MGNSGDKEDIRRTVAFSSELWEEIGTYAKRNAPMSKAQAVKKLIAIGLHTSKFDVRDYLSVSTLDDE